MIKIKNQGYISLHVTEIKELHCMYFTLFHVFRIISRISHHFILYFISFNIFYVILCYISHILLYTSHASHTYHACRAFRISWTVHISCIALYFTSFYMSFHVISSWKFISHSFISFRSEERRKRVKTTHSSIERLSSEAF